MSIHLEDAVGLARRAHLGQKDQEGEPYILHVLTVLVKVAEHGADEDAQIVALLHDVLEDTDLTLDALRLAGVTALQLEALQAITRRPDERYRDYVQRALENPIARIVKLADNEHNTDPRRMARLAPETADRLRRKYEGVADLIEAARNQREPNSGGTR